MNKPGVVRKVLVIITAIGTPLCLAMTILP